MQYIGWFFTHPRLDRGHSFDSLRRTPVAKVDRTAVDKASGQNFCGNFASANVDLTVSTRALLLLSATPFCSGVYGTVNS